MPVVGVGEESSGCGNAHGRWIGSGWAILASSEPGIVNTVTTIRTPDFATRQVAKLNK